MKRKSALIIIAAFTAGSMYGLWNIRDSAGYRDSSDELTASAIRVSAEDPEGLISELPNAKTILGLSHAWQSRNNCSSVGLMITLSHWGIQETQERIAEATRPWNKPRGTNDDKSVTLYELGDYAEARHGMLTYVRPNGDIELLKKFIAHDIPVLTKALIYPQDDIAHYRVVRGYDEEKKLIIESDGIEGPNQPYSYEEWMHLWKDFNYSYLILVPKEKQELVENLLGEDADERTAWQNAKTLSEREILKDSSDMRAHYNLVTALYYLGDYEAAVREFEKIEYSLTRRKLWYQMESIDAYFKLGRYDRVIELADNIINDNNNAVSELYMLKGKIYESRGEMAKARVEYERALYYHKYFQPAKDALSLLE